MADPNELSPALLEFAQLLAVLRGAGVARYRYGGADIQFLVSESAPTDELAPAIGFSARPHDEDGEDGDGDEETGDDVSPEAQRAIDAALRRRREEEPVRATRPIGPGRPLPLPDGEERSAYHNRSLWGDGGPPRFPGTTR